MNVFLFNNNIAYEYTYYLDFKVAKKIMFTFGKYANIYDLRFINRKYINVNIADYYSQIAPAMTGSID